MKQKNDKNLKKVNSQSGFTIVELLAVMAIMTLLLGVLVIDFASQRGTRNIVLAKNEVATGLRKVQSYMLSSKNLSSGESVKYYIATFTAGSTSYTVDAVDSNYVYHGGVETVKLPSEVKISEIRIMNPSTKQDTGGGDEEVKGGGITRGGLVTPAEVYTTYSCIQVIFSAPFGKMYTNGASSCDSTIKDTLRDPVQRAALSDRTAQIFFAKTSDSSGSSYLEVVPLTNQFTLY